MTLLPRINPVTLKELRQLMRSRLIVWGMVVLPVLLLAAGEGVHLLDVFELNTCHSFGSGHTASAWYVLAGLRKGTRRITTGLHTAAPRAGGVSSSFF